MSAFESKKYSWRSGYSYRTPADVVGSVLEDIEKKNGEVTAESFLEESREPSSPTHSMFEWDDSVAAEKYRLRQSSQIINQLEISVEVGEIETVTAFVNVKSKSVKDSGSFVNIRSAMSDEEYRKQVLDNALAELKSFKKRYAQYSELAIVFRSITEYERKVD